MNKKILIQIFSYMLLLSSVSFAQTASVSVNPLTGTGSVAIPIYSMSSGQVSVPINLVYNATGIKPKEVESTAGMGWQLDVGGQVSRQVRGLPDDVTADNASNARYGWMSSSNTAAAAIGSFTVGNNEVNCTLETTDISNINSYFPYNYDTEPDLFYVSAPGLSCQLVYDRTSGKFKPVSYQDLVITYGTNSTTHLITSFTITNNRGITYTFGDNSDLSPAYEKVIETTNGGSQLYFKTKYLQYQYGITYNDSWGLLSVTDANGNGVQLNYTTPLPMRAGTDSVALYIGGLTSSNVQYYDKTRTTPVQLQSIETFNANNYAPNSLTFTWYTPTGSGSTGASMISGITGMGRTFYFSYSGVTYNSSYTRQFLRNYYENGCSSPVNYQFAYAGETYLGGASYTTALPDSASNKTDYWGYYSTTPSTSVQIPAIYINPSSTSYPRYLISASGTYNSAYTYALSNTSRQVDPTVIAYGSLNQITYAAGGNTSIVYEPNDYYDPSAGVTVKGGGIRVKQVIDAPATGAGNSITRNYSYLNSSGASSGKPVSLPQFAFTIPYSGSATGLTLWSDATALSAHDLSREDHTIMYSSCKESQTGAGYTVYQYYVPSTFWDANGGPGCSSCSGPEWYPTVNYAGRSNCTSTYGPVVYASTYSYPFIPNPNYDFERGLLQSVSSYTDAGSQVSESDYTYARSYSPTAITAFKSDDNVSGSLSVKGYNKYTIYYNTSELAATVVKKVFDSALGGTSQTSTSTYTYGSSNHKLPTQVQSTNSDGSTITTNTNYVKDYSVASGTNANVTALYNMQLQNINIPVEKWQQVTRSGSTATTSASLTLFRDTSVTSAVLGTTLTDCLPSQQLKWVQPSGGSFTPMTISGQTLTKDGGYFTTANYDNYDYAGFPLTVDDANKHIQTTLVHHFANQPIAVFKNAAYGQVAYSDFDGDLTSPDYAFSISGTGFTPSGSHAGNAYGLNTSQTVSKTVTKNPIAQNYIFSIWVNATVAGNINVSLNGGTAVSIPYSNTGWQYLVKKLSVSGLTSPLTISVTTNQAASVDDILFYPDVSQVSTATYDPTTHFKLDATNTNGVSAYYSYDTWGRLVFAYDQDKNIVQKNTFITPGSAASFGTTPTIGAPSTVVNGSPAGFSILGPDACAAAGVTVQWNFGDGTGTFNTSGLTSPSHTFTGIGTVYSVSAVVTSPLFGTFTPSNVNVTVQPALIPLSYNTYTFSNGNITLVTFTPVGSGTSYSFTGSQLNSAHVLQGNYTISVTLTGGTHYNSGTGAGYSSVLLTSDCYNACLNWVSTNTYSFSANISSCTGLNFSVYQSVCSVGIE